MDALFLVNEDDFYDGDEAEAGIVDQVLDISYDGDDAFCASKTWGVDDRAQTKHFQRV
jgi:hypothetical protein